MTAVYISMRSSRKRCNESEHAVHLHRDFGTAAKTGESIFGNVLGGLDIQ